MELEVTWRRAVKVWWSYLWRNVIAIIGAMLAGVVVGFIIGFVLGALGASMETIQIITTPIGVVIGLLTSIIPIKMILGMNFGEFRLVLVKNNEESEPTKESVPIDETPNTVLDEISEYVQFLSSAPSVAEVAERTRVLCASGYDSESLIDIVRERAGINEVELVERAISTNT